MAWRLDSKRPIYMQIVERVQYDIVAGIYGPGERLPSVRDLAIEAAVNPNTMQRALSSLEQSGLVSNRRTLGRFVTEDEAVIAGVRHALAEQQCGELIRNMQRLGFTKEEVIRLIEKNYREAADEHTSGNA